ncbi:SagB/ThcOx family dehydrogenase [[Actinomadura] parvosata]|uniref:SagB/ThcOx family dehydrogenase n=1 Tax=[Actinomadura] parvosata TaxID=1955412 RepID=UPI0022A83FAE|nr:SagB/ThcOx family dehydrogenase [Nonomuraea sp. ATCC 55076]
MYETAGEDDRHDLTADGRPPLFTAYPQAHRVLLPRVPAPLDAPLGEVLYRRRTHRRFAGRPVPLPALAALLSTVFGPVDYIDGGGFGALFRRTSPQGGARQELDAYVGIRSVDATAPGWYHYNVREHCLELLAGGCTAEELATLCGGQGWAADACFVVVLVARVERMLVKYRNPRAYRVCLLDAGHLGQTFVLTATALGLGPFQTGAFHDTALAARLNLDGVTSVPLYVLGAGLPESTPDPDARPAGLTAFRHTTL